MKKIEAIIRATKLEELRIALAEIDITNMTVTQVMGLGQQEGYLEMYRGVEHKIDFLHKYKVDIIIEDEQLSECLATITTTCRTGEIGDGNITVSALEQVIHIRTGELVRDSQ